MDKLKRRNTFVQQHPKKTKIKPVMNVCSVCDPLFPKQYQYCKDCIFYKRYLIDIK